MPHFLASRTPDLNWTVSPIIESDKGLDLPKDETPKVTSCVSGKGM